MLPISGGYICYASVNIKVLEIMRYTNYIPTKRGESGKLDLSFLRFDTTIFYNSKKIRIQGMRHLDLRAYFV